MKNTQTIALAIRERSCQSNAMMTDQHKETYVSLDKVRSSHFRAKIRSKCLESIHEISRPLSLSLSLSLTLVSPSLIAFVGAHSLSRVRLD